MHTGPRKPGHDGEQSRTGRHSHSPTYTDIVTAAVADRDGSEVSGEGGEGATDQQMLGLKVLAASTSV